MNIKYLQIGGGKSLRFSFILTSALLLTFAIASCTEPEGEEGNSRASHTPDSIINNTTQITIDTVWKDTLYLDLDEYSGQ